MWLDFSSQQSVKYICAGMFSSIHRASWPIWSHVTFIPAMKFTGKCFAWLTNKCCFWKKMTVLEQNPRGQREAWSTPDRCQWWPSLRNQLWWSWCQIHQTALKHRILHQWTSIFAGHYMTLKQRLFSFSLHCTFEHSCFIFYKMKLGSSDVLFYSGKKLKKNVNSDARLQLGHARSLIIQSSICRLFAKHFHGAHLKMLSLEAN